MKLALPRLQLKRVLVDSGAFDPWLVAALVIFPISLVLVLHLLLRLAQAVKF